MTLLYTDPRFLEHRTGNHPERPERLRQITRRLLETGLPARCREISCAPISPERLARVHAPDYVEEVRAFAEQGGGLIEADTVVSEQSFNVALLAAGAVCDAVERVTQGEDATALCLVRPPGHHALPSHAMGFCLFNNIAVAARMAVAELGLDRVLVVDWDVHHGNGTQDIFYADEQVGFLSIHRYPFYPGTGAKDETGTGRGLGTTLNLPVSYGTPRKDFLSRFANELEVFVDKLRPQLILISAGFDAHREDPIGSLDLETEDLAALTRIVLDVAKTHAGGRVVSVLEGGYNVQALADSVELHLEEMLV